jgi:hypothetical protein
MSFVVQVDAVDEKGYVLQLLRMSASAVLQKHLAIDEQIPQELAAAHGAKTFLGISLSDIPDARQIVVRVFDDAVADYGSPNLEGVNLTTAEINSIAMLHAHCERSIEAGLPAFVENNIRLWDSAISKLRDELHRVTGVPPAQPNI